MKKAKRLHRGGGFTLIELMVVTAIIGIIASLAPRVLIEVERFFLLNRTRLSLQRDSRADITLMTRAIRQAVATSIVIDQKANQPYYSRITFRKQDSSISTSTDNIKMSFYQDGRTLKMDVTPRGSVTARTSTLSSDLRFLAFSLPDSTDLTIVSVSLTMEHTIFEGKLKALHLASEKVRVMNPGT